MYQVQELFKVNSIKLQGSFKSNSLLWLLFHTVFTIYKNDLTSC